MTHVIESNEYRDEIAALIADPIIQAMAEEVATAPDFAKVNLAGHEFMGAANAEYDRRGGTNARSLGGVARAIASCIAQDSRFRRPGE